MLSLALVVGCASAEDTTQTDIDKDPYWSSGSETNEGKSTHLFIDRAHAGPEMAEAMRALARDRTKNLARDLLDREHEPAPEPLRERPSQERGRERTRQRDRGMSLGL